RFLVAALARVRAHRAAFVAEEARARGLRRRGLIFAKSGRTFVRLSHLHLDEPLLAVALRLVYSVRATRIVPFSPLSYWFA
ncbi:MAG TPA: hypothetical protein VKS80_11500, partial [Trinickia sp.]|nr:hypothetical protein [Trinickia sp.]